MPNTRKRTMDLLLHDIHAIRHKMMAGHVGKHHFNITPSQGFVLRIVATNPDASVKTVSRELRITSSAATQLVEGLVKKGYLKRAVNPQDRRAVTLAIAPKAQALFKKFKAHGMAKMQRLFAGLTDRELAQYAALNKKILNSIS
jgi:DNA-binding MarR family transcriptional regulator